MFPERALDDVRLDREIDESKVPPVGETVTYKGKTLKVVFIDRFERKVKLVQIDDERRKFSVPIDSYRILFKDEPDIVKVNPKGFVTSYAGKSPEENFAEMGAFYCTDELSPEQKADFEQLLV